MSENSARSATTLAVVFAQYAYAHPKDAATTKCALKTLYGHHAEADGVPLDTILARVPFTDHVAKFEGASNRYTVATIAELMSRGFDQPTHLAGYRRHNARLAAFGTSLGAAETIVKVENLPGWNGYLGALAQFVPASVEETMKYCEANCSLVLGRYPIGVRDVAQEAKTMQDIHWANGKLARVMSGQGIDLDDFNRDFICGPRFREIPEMVFNGTPYYACRNAWNEIAKALPSLEMSLWPTRFREVSILMGAWHPLLAGGVNQALFSPSLTKNLEPSTISTYTRTMTTFVGVLHSLGFDHHKLLQGLGSERAALALTFGACPRDIMTEHGDLDDPLVLANLLAASPELRRQYVAGVLNLAGSYDGKESLTNPFVAIVLEARYDAANYASARQLVQRVMTINERHLELRDRHLVWAKKYLKEIEALEKNSKTDYKEKKKLVYRVPELWLALITKVEALLDELFASDCERNPTWATAVRNLLFLNLILLFPMRINHFIKMRIGKHFDHGKYLITFEEDEVKNKKRFEYALPQRGRYGGVCRRIDAYFNAARPLLLQGKASKHFFVPNCTKHMAGDHLRDKAFNDILEHLSRDELMDVMPEGIETLNPHLIRDIVATYQIVIEGNVARAAQLLNDKLETVLKNYSDILECSRDRLRGYYEDLS